MNFEEKYILRQAAGEVQFSDCLLELQTLYQM